MRKASIIYWVHGTGKTTVGKRLAVQLGYRFVDTDRLIEARSGMTVPEIFERRGQAAFRALEARERRAQLGVLAGDRHRRPPDAGGGQRRRPGPAGAGVLPGGQRRGDQRPGRRRPGGGAPDAGGTGPDGAPPGDPECKGGDPAASSPPTSGKTPAQVATELLTIIRTALGVRPARLTLAGRQPPTHLSGETMKKVLVLHGVNLNMFGHRDPAEYGRLTLTQIDENCAGRATRGPRGVLPDQP